MQRRRTLLLSDAGALFGWKACQSAAVSQWSCLVRGLAAPFLRQFSNTPALNAARASPIGCAPPCAGACGGAPEATLRRWRNTQPWQHIHRCAIPLDVRATRARARARGGAPDVSSTRWSGIRSPGNMFVRVAPRRRRNTQPGQHLHQKAQPDIAGIRSPGKQIHQTRR